MNVAKTIAEALAKEIPGALVTSKPDKSRQRIGTGIRRKSEAVAALRKALDSSRFSATRNAKLDEPGITLQHYRVRGCLVYIHQPSRFAKSCDKLYEIVVAVPPCTKARVVDTERGKKLQGLNGLRKGLLLDTSLSLTNSMWDRLPTGSVVSVGLSWRGCWEV